jgi:hypothetical protein
MRWLFFVCAYLGAEVASSTNPDLRMIDDLNECVRVRFETTTLVTDTVSLAVEPTAPGMNPVFSSRMQSFVVTMPVVTMPALGMSRIASPPSIGRHFSPQFNVSSDFTPENDREKKVVASLGAARLHVGLFVIGRAILGSDSEKLNYRALKGPAAMTAGTPRPGWYPMGELRAVGDNALPDWNAVYPLARKAMKSFTDGGTGFETEIDSWNIAARPVLASQQRCLACHGGLALNQPVGGVLYTYRRATIH